MWRSQLLLTTTLLWTVILIACKDKHQPAHPPALVVCPGATAINWTTYGSTDQLSYRVRIEYPAQGVLSCISGRLAATGWDSLKNDFWNPGLPSSHVRGWTHFVDAAVRPEAQVDAWAAQWQNKSGDLVWYYLSYRYPPDDRSMLNVAAGFVPVGSMRKGSKGSRN